MVLTNRKIFLRFYKRLNYSELVRLRVLWSRTLEWVSVCLHTKNKHACDWRVKISPLVCSSITGQAGANFTETQNCYFDNADRVLVDQLFQGYLLFNCKCKPIGIFNEQLAGWNLRSLVSLDFGTEN